MRRLIEIKFTCFHAGTWISLTTARSVGTQIGCQIFFQAGFSTSFFAGFL